MTGKQKAAMSQAWLTQEPRLLAIGHMASLASQEMMDETNVNERTAFAVHHLDDMISALIGECRTAHQEACND